MCKREKRKGKGVFLFFFSGVWIDREGAIILPHFLTSAHFLATKHSLNVKGCKLDDHVISITPSTKHLFLSRGVAMEQINQDGAPQKIALSFMVVMKLI